MPSKIEGYHMVKVECQGAGRLAIDGELANKLLKWIDGRTGFNLTDGERNYVIHAEELSSVRQFDLFYRLGEFDGTFTQFTPGPGRERSDSETSDSDDSSGTSESQDGSGSLPEPGMGHNQAEAIPGSESDNGVRDGKSAAAGELS